MKIYHIQPGDTLSDIAFSHGIEVKALLFVNPQITNPDYIRAGDYLHIPDYIRAGDYLHIPKVVG